METLITIGLIIAIVLIIRANWAKAFKDVQFESSAVLVTDLPPDSAMDVLLEVFRRAPFRATVLQMRPGFVLFKRGNWSEERLGPAMNWYQAPLLTSAACYQDRGRTVIQLMVLGPKYADFTDGAQTWFVESASRDVELVRHKLKPPPPPASETSQKPKLDALGRAYAVLRLQPGAPWPEVQSAYREVVKQYHPDRLSGQNLSPHVVDLVVREFKLKTQAYQTLKQHLAA